MKGKWIVAGAIAVLAGGSVATGAEAPSEAVAYVNRDTGAATENSDVKEGSSCAAPDRRDRQQTSDEEESNRNVHVDACLSDAAGNSFDGRRRSHRQVPVPSAPVPTRIKSSPRYRRS